MIIDFHVHVLPPEDMPGFTGTGFHRNIRATRTGTVPTTIENALEAAKIGGVDITVISNPIHDLRDMDRAQQLERCKRQNHFNAAQQAKYPRSSAWRRRCLMAATRSCASSNAR